jgi:hypothetical protein
VVEGLGSAELVDPGRHELGGLESSGTVERDHPVERPVGARLGRCAVVAVDEDDQGVVEDSQLLDRVDHPAYLEVAVVHEPGVDLHLPGEHGLEVVGDRRPR